MYEGLTKEQQNQTEPRYLLKVLGDFKLRCLKSKLVALEIQEDHHIDLSNFYQECNSLIEKVELQIKEQKKILNDGIQTQKPEEQLKDEMEQNVFTTFRK
jgi:hypothetical protein